MNEIILFGALISIVVFSFALSFDNARSLRQDDEPRLRPAAPGAEGIDIDLTGCEPSTQELRKPGSSYRSPAVMAENEFRELTQELRALDITQVDFDLSTMAAADDSELR